MPGLVVERGRARGVEGEHQRTFNHELLDDGIRRQRMVRRGDAHAYFVRRVRLELGVLRKAIPFVERGERAQNISVQYITPFCEKYATR